MTHRLEAGECSGKPGMVVARGGQGTEVSRNAFMAARFRMLLFREEEEDVRGLSPKARGRDFSDETSLCVSFDSDLLSEGEMKKEREKRKVEAENLELLILPGATCGAGRRAVASELGVRMHLQGSVVLSGSLLEVRDSS